MVILKASVIHICIQSYYTDHVIFKYNFIYLKPSPKIRFLILRGQGGVPWVQIMENEFECLVVRGGDVGHFAEKFVKKYCS